MRLARQYNILLIGDSCTDEWVYGSVNRLSPEAPVPVLKYRERQTAPGMAGNVHENLKSLGMTVNFITNKEKITKTRYIDGKSNQQIVRVDDEPELTGIHQAQLQMALMHETYDAIVISDYNKGFVNVAEVVTYIASRNPTVKIFVDTKATKLPLGFENVVYKINQKEFEALDPETIPPAKNLIVTRGPLGAVWNKKQYPVNQIERVFDVSGAGDTFLSALVFYYVQLPSMEEAIAFANRSASIAVQNPGTYTLTMEDVDEILK